jgi:3'-5' exoribonuclease
MEQELNKIIIKSFVIDKISINDKYVEIELNDGTTKTIALLKDNIDIFSKTYAIGDKVVCKGRMRKRRKNECLDLIYIKKDTLESKIENKFNVEELISRFNEIVTSIDDVDYKSILTNCFNDDVKELYFIYPAARSKHHNYTHGLLQHSIQVVDISLFLANYANDVDKNLIKCAGLLHDIGKLKSYDVNDDFTNIEKSDWEHLLGHLSISALFVSKIIPSDVDSKKAMLLYHILLSHHEKLEWGSPVVCKTKEAFIISKADQISCDLNHINSLKYKDSWSELDKSNKSWFRSKEDV